MDLAFEDSSSYTSSEIVFFVLSYITFAFPASEDSLTTVDFTAIVSVSVLVSSAVFSTTGLSITPAATADAAASPSAEHFSR